MPMTRSEAMFFTAGLVIGAAAAPIIPSLKKSWDRCSREPWQVPARRLANPTRRWPRRWRRRWKRFRTRWPR